MTPRTIVAPDVHLADLADYAKTHGCVDAACGNRDVWARNVLKVAASGHVSSVRTVAEYAADVWLTVRV
jgi:glucan phosphorylase